MRYVLLGVLLFISSLLFLGCMGLRAVHDLFAELLTGWVRFPARVWPQLRVSWVGVTAALVALVVLAVGLQYFLSWVYVQSALPDARPERRWPVRRTLTILGVVLLMFVAGIAATGAAHQTTWLFTSGERVFEDLVNARQQSANNLRQIGLASLQYADTHTQSFPAGGTFDSHGRRLHGWMTPLLPLLDEGALHSRIDFTLPWDDPRNAPVFGERVDVYLLREARLPVKEDGFALTHYAGNIRVLGGDVGRKVTSITDGLSTTILAGEAAGNFKPWGHPTNWRDPARGLNRSPDGFGSPLGARAGGVNLLMADGSVHFLNPDTAPAVLKALATPDAGDAARLPREVDRQ